MMIKEGSTKIVHFMIPRLGALVLERGHIMYVVKMNYILPYQCKAHWLIYCEGIIMLLSSAIVDFHLFFDGAVWQEASVESLI